MDENQQCKFDNFCKRVHTIAQDYSTNDITFAYQLFTHSVQILAIYKHKIIASDCISFTNGENLYAQFMGFILTVKSCVKNLVNN